LRVKKSGEKEKRRRRTLLGNWYIINNNRKNYEVEDRNIGKILYVPRWVLSKY